MSTIRVLLSHSQSVCVRNCGDQKKGRLKACRRGWNWIVVSLYVRGSGYWCQYRCLVDSCLGNRRRRRERTGISVGSFLTACRLTNNEGNFHKCHQYIIVCVHRHHHSHSADMFRPRLAIVQYSSHSGITCISYNTKRFFRYTFLVINCEYQFVNFGCYLVTSVPHTVHLLCHERTTIFVWHQFPWRWPVHTATSEVAREKCILGRNFTRTVDDHFRKLCYRLYLI